MDSRDQVGKREQTVINEQLVRISLWISVPFNFLAAYAVLLPGSALGQLIGLPPDVPLIYAALLSFMVGAFGCVYAWLASRPLMNKPVLAIGAIGKTGVFVIALALWLMGEGPGGVVFVATGDLAFATLWVMWLTSSSGTAIR